MRTKFKNKIPLCACGCSNFVYHNQNGKKQWNKFIHGHNMVGKIMSIKTKKKLSKKHTGIKHSIEAKEKLRQANLGKKLSEETKRKISKALKGRKFSSETKKKLSEIAIKREVSTEQKEKLRQANIGRKLSVSHKKKLSLINSGENHPQWKGGIACEPYCDVWLDEEYKQSIRDRDNNECQNPDCWHTANHLSLHIHHIDYIKKNCVPKNLITLCNSCNSRANFNRERHTKFYQEIIEQKYKLKEAA